VGRTEEKGRIICNKGRKEKTLRGRSDVISRRLREKREFVTLTSQERGGT